MRKLRFIVVAGLGAVLSALVISTLSTLASPSSYNPSLAANPVWDPLHRSAVAEAEFEAEAMGMSYAATITKLVLNEGNFLYRFYRDIKRKVDSGPADPDWKPDAWIDAHQNRIRSDRLWRFMLTRNETEAEFLLADMHVQERDAALLAIRFGLAH